MFWPREDKQKSLGDDARFRSSRHVQLGRWNLAARELSLQPATGGQILPSEAVGASIPGKRSYCMIAMCGPVKMTSNAKPEVAPGLNRPSRIW